MARKSPPFRPEAFGNSHAGTERVFSEYIQKDAVIGAASITQVLHRDRRWVFSHRAEMTLSVKDQAAEAG